MAFDVAYSTGRKQCHTAGVLGRARICSKAFMPTLVCMFDRVCRLNRAALHELEKDTADKFIALNLENTSRRFQNTSRGIHYQDGIERVDNT